MRLICAVTLASLGIAGCQSAPVSDYERQRRSAFLQQMMASQQSTYAANQQAIQAARANTYVAPPVPSPVQRTYPNSTACEMIGQQLICQHQ